jgi:hypothetical protein
MKPINLFKNIFKSILLLIYNVIKKNSKSNVEALIISLKISRYSLLELKNAITITINRRIDKLKVRLNFLNVAKI